MALVDLPPGHPLRPVERDLRTNCIRTDVTDEEHANAYLQFDVHAAWIIEYFLQGHNRDLPERGLRCKCYSRFDDLLGAVEGVTLHRDGVGAVAEDPFEIAVYNWTGEEFYGVHYDPVYVEPEVPPPPQPLPGCANGRPRKRQKGPSTCKAAAMLASSLPGATQKSIGEATPPPNADSRPV